MGGDKKDGEDQRTFCIIHSIIATTSSLLRGILGVVVL